MSDLQDKYKLRANPFRLTPSNKPEDLIWAGFAGVKEKFEKRIKRSVKIPSSSLVLNWGEYGSGKTHAARFFSKVDVLTPIADPDAIPFSLVMSLPKGKDPIYDMFISVIDKLDIKALKTKFAADYTELESFINTIESNIHIRSVLKMIFNDEEVVGHIAVKKYLYGNMSSTDLKSLSGLEILRNLKIEKDYTLILAGIFSCLTFDKKYYSCVIIWIDEFEDIATLNNTSMDKTNNFIREILDSTPNNLLLFLNLTQSAMVSVEDLGQYLYVNVTSRIKETINFDLPNPIDFKDYLKEMLSSFRSEGVEVNEYFPFNENVVNALIKEQGDVSLRRFNESLSLLLELAEMDKKCPISMDEFNSYKADLFLSKS